MLNALGLETIARWLLEEATVILDCLRRLEVGCRRWRECRIPESMNPPDNSLCPDVWKETSLNCPDASSVTSMVTGVLKSPPSDSTRLKMLSLSVTIHWDSVREMLWCE